MKRTKITREHYKSRGTEKTVQKLGTNPAHRLSVTVTFCLVLSSVFPLCCLKIMPKPTKGISFRSSERESEKPVENNRNYFTENPREDQK